ncbi:MAG: hypothetical protein AAGG48_24010 [Planctomycetota bacterium]
MDRFHRVLIGCFLASSVLWCVNAVAQTTEPRDVSQVQIHGLTSISVDSIIERLENQPEVFEATHRSIDQATFAFRVREAVARGMLASGFLDSHVELSSQTEPVQLTIDEGKRFRNGTVRVKGASPMANGWIAEQLTVASTAKEDADPVWELGKPAVGTLFGAMARLQSVRDRLTEVGLNGAKADVRCERDEETFGQLLIVDLDASDASFTVARSKPSDNLVNDHDETNSDQQSEGSSRPSVTGVAAELIAVHQRWFARPTPGVRVRHEDETTSIDLWCGEEAAVAIVNEGGHERTIVYKDGELQLGMENSSAAIRVPVPNALLTITQSAASECEDNKTMKISFSGNASSDKPDGSPLFGMMFTEAAWTEWFPPARTRRTESETATIFQYEDHVLKVDLDGNLIQLRGFDPAERLFVIDRVSEKQVQEFTAHTVADADPIGLFVQDPNSNQRISLKSLWDEYEKDRTNKDEFNIPPAGGKRDVFGVVILAVVHDGRLVKEDSLVGRIAQLYALELSRNRRTLMDRIAEIEAEAMKGAVTSAVLGDLVKRQGNGGIETALRYMRHSQSLLEVPSAAEHDMDVLLDPSNLIGRVFRQVDLKQWLQVCIQWGKPFSEQQQTLDDINSLLSGLPDASIEDERLANARSIATTAYEVAGSSFLERYLDQSIADLESRQQRLAKKKEEKKRK